VEQQDLVLIATRSVSADATNHEFAVSKDRILCCRTITPPPSLASS